MDSPPSVSVVIPVYNNQTTLPVLVARIDAVLSEFSYEIIFVDDGSADNSWQVIQQLSQTQNNIMGIKLAQNMGQHPATIVGMQNAQYPIAITMDDDLHHMPEHIPLMLNQLKENVGLVYAGPEIPLKGKLYAIWVALIKLIIGLSCNALFLRHMQTFRVVRLTQFPWQEVEIHKRLTVEGVLKKLRPTTTKIKVKYQPRIGGFSTYTIRKLIAITLDIIFFKAVINPVKSNKHIAEIIGNQRDSQE